MMFKKILAYTVVCLLVVGGFGCGGSGETVYKDAPGPIANPGLDKALEAEAAGKPLTGKQKRVLEDAREAGAIPAGEGAAPAPAP